MRGGVVCHADWTCNISERPEPACFLRSAFIWLMDLGISPWTAALGLSAGASLCVCPCSRHPACESSKHADRLPVIALQHMGPSVQPKAWYSQQAFSISTVALPTATYSPSGHQPLPPCLQGYLADKGVAGNKHDDLTFPSGCPSTPNQPQSRQTPSRSLTNPVSLQKHSEQRQAWLITPLLQGPSLGFRHISAMACCPAGTTQFREFYKLHWYLLVGLVMLELIQLEQQTLALRTIRWQVWVVFSLPCTRVNASLLPPSWS